MTRLFLLLAAVLTLNACEQHKAQDLPEEFQEGKKHGATAEPSAAARLAGR